MPYKRLSKRQVQHNRRNNTPRGRVKAKHKRRASRAYHRGEARLAEELNGPVIVTRHSRHCAAFQQQECDCQDTA